MNETNETIIDKNLPLNLSPEERVFHIDTECYIVYLGSEPDDYKPFLRIGTSEHLPEEIIKNVYYIVITDSFTGNPLLEPKNINTEEIEDNRFIGDRDTLKRFLSFLKIFNINPSVQPIEQTTEIENRRAVILFFEDGNIDLQFDKKSIFNLRKREKQDNHFVEWAKKAREDLKNDPLFLKDSFFIDKSGFVPLYEIGKNSEESLGFFINGKIHLHKITDKFFQEFLKYRIDPDIISSLTISRATEGFVKILKRNLNIGKSLKIGILQYTDELEHKIIESLVELFNKKNKIFEIIRNRNFEPFNGLKISSKKEKPYSNQPIFQLKSEDKKVNVAVIGKSYKNLQKSKIKPSDKNTPILILDMDEKIGYTSSGEKSSNFPLLPGIPCFLEVEKIPEKTTIIESIERLYYLFNNQFSIHCQNSISVLYRIIKNPSTLKSLNKGLKQFWKEAKKSDMPLDFLIIAFSMLEGIKNVLIIPERNHKEIDKSPGGSKTLIEKLKVKTLKAIQSQLLKEKTQPEVIMPLSCTLFINKDDIYTVFDITNPAISRVELEALQNIQQKLEPGLSLSKSGVLPIFEEDKNRLLSLLNKINTLTRGTSSKKSSITKDSKYVKAGTQDELAIKKTERPKKSRGIEPSQTEEAPGREVKISPEKSKLERKTATFGDKYRVSESIKQKTGPKKMHIKGQKPGKKRKISLLISILGILIVMGSALFVYNSIKSSRKDQNKLLLPEKVSEIKQKNNLQQKKDILQDKVKTKSVEGKSEGKPAEIISSKPSEGNAQEKTDTGTTASGIPRGVSVPENLEFFLDLGYIKITILDVYNLTNKIAVSNGYRSLNSTDELGKDPNWIFPGNIFRLPDGSLYTVVKGDTIWYIARRFIKKQMDRDWKIYKDIENSINRDKIDKKKSEFFVKRLKELKNKSYCENFTKILDKTIERLQK